jgi:hypothetical protein
MKGCLRFVVEVEAPVSCLFEEQKRIGQFCFLILVPQFRVRSQAVRGKLESDFFQRLYTDAMFNIAIHLILEFIRSARARE